MNKQQASNERVQRAVDALKATQYQSNLQHTDQINDINKKLHELLKLNNQHKEVEKHVIDWLEKLEDRSLELQHIMTDEQFKKDDLIERFDRMSESQAKIDDSLHLFTSIIDEMSIKLNENTTIYKEIEQRLQQMGETNDRMINKISDLDVTQHEMINRVDLQEGLLEKLSRQMDNIRSILFERTNFLDEKIRKIYEYFSRSYS